MIIFVWLTGVNRRQLAWGEGGTSATPGPPQPPRVAEGLNSLVSLPASWPSTTHPWHGTLLGKKALGQEVWPQSQLWEVTESAITLHLALGTLWNKNRDVSHRGIRDLLHGQSQEKSRCVQHCVITHTKQVILVNKGLKVGSDNALESSLQAFITAEMLHQEKGWNSAPFSTLGNSENNFTGWLLNGPKVMITNDWVNCYTWPHLSSYRSLIGSLIRISDSSWLMTSADQAGLAPSLAPSIIVAGGAF